VNAPGLALTAAKKSVHGGESFERAVLDIEVEDEEVKRR
jgi:hypothetical protein